MALGLVEALAALEFERDHLVGTDLVNDLGGDRGTCKEGASHTDAVTVAGSEDLVKGHGVTHRNVEFLHFDLVACRDAILLPTGLDNCVCHRALPALRGRESATTGDKRQAFF